MEWDLILWYIALCLIESCVYWERVHCSFICSILSCSSWREWLVDKQNGKSSSAEATASCYCYDIGEIIAHCQSEEEVAVKLQSLSPAQKYALLTKHSTPTEDFDFPATFAGGCNRIFRRVWLKEHWWLTYSTLLDDAFCLPCALFSDNDLKGKFVTKPFKTWIRKQRSVRSTNLDITT